MVRKEWQESSTDDWPVGQVSPTNIPPTAQNYSRNKGVRQQIQCECEYNFCFGLDSVFPPKFWLINDEQKQTPATTQAPALTAQGVICACFCPPALPVEATVQGRCAVFELMKIWTVSLTVVKSCTKFRESNKRLRLLVQRGKGQKGFSMGSVLQDGELDRDLQHFCEQGRLCGDDAVAWQHLWDGFLLKGSCVSKVMPVTVQWLTRYI